MIPAVGASAKAPGEWTRYSFPLDHLPVEGLSNLRVKFELAGAGEVWIDDVQVFDLAFSEAERKELVKLLSMASLNLDRGQVSDWRSCSTAIGRSFSWPTCPWRRCPSPSGRAPRSGESPPAAATKKNVLENLKGYLPKLQR